ncbi:MAG: ATP-dependent DNA helicase [Clostridium sp.]|nr:ATP-dependent DNA helicase [Acetatifactor muris]MCM1526999.1 ATP-dependent DNA helicase [Bacteroides sp.]MCM1563162.1 ATP-dependent DNA helicase [Clostridium sp.]
MRPDLRKADNENTRTEMPPGEVRVSVRGLVEFILRHGDIDNRYQGSVENAMQEGSRIHRMIQRRMGADYQAEVSLRYTFPTEQYTLIVEGRADGIIENAEGVTVDEIKGTYRDVARMKEPALLHVAQAKCYAYIYSLQKELSEIRVRMTYCNMETEEIRYFYLDYSFKQLEGWFNTLIADYRKWADYTWQWRQIRQRSIEQLEFPFSYREGQRELVAYVYQTIYHKKKLFLEAPTGVGKTISAIFPAVKALGKNMGERLFYLTAKTITRTVADDTLELLRGKGLRFKSVILTAKEKICFMEQAECNPENCPYAKGHYDRINEAVYALLTTEERFDRDIIEEYAIKYQVCPFEFCLDMSLFADGIIGDYNYLFDPHVYLKRFFSDGNSGDYLFLIDEAHNLVDRGREMYSAALLKEDFLSLKREIQQTIMSEMEKKSRKNQVSGQMTLDMTIVSQIMDVQDLTEMAQTSGQDGKSRSGKSVLVKGGYGEKLQHHLDRCNKELLPMKKECESYRTVESIDGFVNALMRLYSVMADYLEEQEEAKLPVRDSILDLYFRIAHFLDIYERLDEHYIKYTQIQEDGSFMLKLFCVNPRENLKKCMEYGRSSILFSATFLPVQYYKELLGGDAEDYEVYAKSVFRPEKRAIFIANDVTSKYSRRSDEEFGRIARYIREIVKNRHGNYMVFFPSYSFMQKIYDLYVQEFAGEEQECILQQEYMSEEDRESFLSLFKGNADLDLQQDILMEIEEQDHTLIAFCVLGGIFGEGIDLTGDSLIGAIIVGTGIPQVCCERELLKQHFDGIGENGFDYAYRYPGMNKVLQAAGRVIRTAEDVGIIALLDERFLQLSNRRLFPREWESFETVYVDGVAKRVEHFWDEWL